MSGVCDVCLARGWRWELWPLASGGVPRGSDGVRGAAALLGGFCEGRGWGGFVCPSVLGVSLLLQFSEFPPPGFSSLPCSFQRVPPRSFLPCFPASSRLTSTASWCLDVYIFFNY